MNNPLVSVLVPVFNVEPYIERCARSLFEQTYHNLEYIFCDDCSIDASIGILEAVIKDYPQRAAQIKIIRHESNRGSAVARNTLIANCKGVFLFWVDSDDWVEVNAVDLMVKKQSKNDADIVTCRCYGHYGDTMKEYFDGGCNLDKDTLLEMILRGKCGSSVWRRLIRKSLYTDHNIKCLEGVNGRDDFQLIVPLIYFSKKVDSIDAFLYHYDRTPHQSITYDKMNNLTFQIHSMISRLAMRDFFIGKDDYYVRIISEGTISVAHKYMVHHCQYRNRKGYQTMVEYITALDKNYWHKIRWNNWIIRTIESNYYMMCLTYPFRQLRHKLS